MGSSRLVVIEVPEPMLAPKALLGAHLAGTRLGKIISSDPLRSALAREYFDVYHSRNYQDISLTVETGGIPVLHLQCWFSGSSASYFGMPARLYALNDAVPDSTLDFLFSEFCRVARERKIKSIMVYSTPALFAYFKGCKSTVETRRSAWIDLTQTPEKIRQGLRKSYKSLVNWGLRSLEMRVIDSRDANVALFSQFHEFHVQVSGRQTRSEKTWDIQWRMILENQAFLLLSFLEGRLVSGNLIAHSDVEAYYGVGVYDRALMAEGNPMAHGSLYRAILECKNRGITRFVLGETTTGVSVKQDNIALFKTGFTNTYSDEEVMCVELAS